MAEGPRGNPQLTQSIRKEAPVQQVRHVPELLRENIRVQRSSGAIEGDWILGGTTSEGGVAVWHVNPATKELERKLIRPSEFLATNPNALIPIDSGSGIGVNVQRSSGQIEQNWRFQGIDEEGYVVVRTENQGQILTKKVSAADFFKLNPDLALPLTEDRSLVAVTRSSGRVEANWYFSGFDPSTRTVTVRRKERDGNISQKAGIPLADFLRQNPGLYIK